MGKAMRATIKRFLANRSGATAIEYALIGVLVSIAIIAGVTNLGNSITTHFSNVSAGVDTAGK